MRDIARATSEPEPYFLIGLTQPDMHTLSDIHMTPPGLPLVLSAELEFSPSTTLKKGLEGAQAVRGAAREGSPICCSNRSLLQKSLKGGIHNAG